MLCARLEPGSGSGIGNKAIIISAKQQSHTEEYGVVHGSSNHTRKNTKEYGVLHVERIIIILKTGKARVAYWSYIRILKELCTKTATRLLIWVCVDCNKNTNFCIALKCLKPGK